METPLVSVVMANYNGAKYIRKAIESVLNQTFKNFEFIIVDDGSTDESRDIIQEYANRDSRIVFLKNPKNLMLCRSLNRGLEVARGKYIARMDSDDICMTERFQKEVNFMERPENARVGVVGSSAIVIDTEENELGKKTFPLEDKDVRGAIWFQTPIQHSTAMILKEAIDECGGYDHSYVHAEDLELWVRIGQKYELRNLPEALILYRVHGNNAIFSNQRRMIRHVLRIRKNAVKKYGYSMPFKAKMAYIATLIAWALPNRLVFWLFMKLRGGVKHPS